MVIAADGRGGSALCRFIGAPTFLEPIGPPTRAPRASPSITVAFAPVKGDRPEWVVQKLTELGIDVIVPLLSDRAVVRWEGARSARALERLGRVSREAAAQSRRVWLPVIGEPSTLHQMLDTAGPGATVVLAERGGGPPSLEHRVIAIGPEGGWSEAERSLGLPRVGLGEAILRAETAAVAAGTLLSALRDSLVAPFRTVS